MPKRNQSNIDLVLQDTTDTEGHVGGNVGGKDHPPNCCHKVGGTLSFEI